MEMDDNQAKMIGRLMPSDPHVILHQLEPLITNSVCSVCLRCLVYLSFTEKADALDHEGHATLELRSGLKMMVSTWP